jgi:hypothetical protein
MISLLNLKVLPHYHVKLEGSKYAETHALAN